MKKILLVDDEESDRVIFENKFKNSSIECELRTTDDGMEAISIIENGYTPDIILLDINMPILGGLETLSLIKGSPETKSIPVIMITGSASEVDASVANDLKADAYIGKPNNDDEFQKLLETVEKLTA